MEGHGGWSERVEEATATLWKRTTRKEKEREDTGNARQGKEIKEKEEEEDHEKGEGGGMKNC